MGALSIFTPQAKYAGERPAYVPTDLGDTTDASFGNTIANFNVDAETRFVGEPILKRNELIKQRLGKDITQLTGIDKKYPNPTQEGKAQMLAEANDAIDDIIQRGRGEFPTIYAGIETTAELRRQGKETADFARSEYENIAMRNPSDISRLTGTLVGGLGAAISDPLNAATMMFGAGEARAIGQGALGLAKGITLAAAKEGAIQAAIQTAAIPQISRWQNEVGHKYGFEEAATDIAFAAGGGFALKGGAEAIAPALRGVRVGTEKATSYVLDKIGANASSVPQTVKDAIKYMSRSAYIDEDAPIDTATRQNLTAHREQYNMTADNVENYRRPSAASSLVDKARASVENGSPASASGSGSQPLPVQRTIPNGSFETAKILPSNRNGLPAKTGDAAVLSVGDIDPTSNSIVYHAFDNVNKLIATAEQLKDNLDNYLKDISGAVKGLEFYGSRVKDKADLVAKTKRKGRKAHTMSDVIGGRVVADTPAAIEQAVAEISKRSKVIEIERKLEGMDGQYRAVHMIVASDKGVSAEIQIQPREIRDVQDIAHEKYYTKWRNRSLKDLSPEEQAEYLSDMQAQSKLFDDAWRKWEERTGTAPAPFDQNTYALREYRKQAPNPPVEVKASDRAQAMRSNFDELVAADPDMIVTIDETGAGVRLADYADMLKQDENIIKALTTCRLA